MSKVQYVVKENTKTGTHSFYAQAAPYQSLTYDEMCRKACEGSEIAPTIMRAAVTQYMQKAQEMLLLGFRVPLGEKFLKLFPQLKCSVKDVLNADGTVKEAATAKMVRANLGVSRIAASVSSAFSSEFRREVSWEKVDKTGAVIDDPDDEPIDVDPENPSSGGDNTTGGTTGGDNTGGSDDNGEGNNE